MRKIQLKNSLDKKDTLVIKGVAILLLLFYHLFETQERIVSLNVDYRPFSQDIFLMLSGFGNICVAVFAFLSAYGITKGLMGQESISPAEMMKQASVRCGKLIGNFVIMYISVNLVWFTRFSYEGLYGKGWQGGMLAVIDMLGLAQLLDTPTLNMTWWYMGLAIVIIFLVPLLYLLAKRIGKYAIVFAILMPLVIEMNSDIKRYLVVIAVGVVAAGENWFEKLFQWKASRIVKAALGLALIALCIPIRQNYMVHTYFLWILDAPVAVLFCWFGGEIMGVIPGVKQVLAFLGKHSMNIFFVHTFFYMIIHQSFFYSFRYAGVIFAVLAAAVLVYSVVLELIKSGGRLVWKRLRHKK